MAEQEDGIVLDVPMEEVAPDTECMFLGYRTCNLLKTIIILVEEIRKAAAKKKGRGFEGSQKSNVRAYESLEDGGSAGPQRSVEVNFDIAK